LRKKSLKTKTQYDLKVHKGESGDDILFNLVKKPGSNDDPEVVKREQRVKNTQAYCKLIIDGRYVAETRKVSIDWPSFEVSILDQF
jgi:hypothetical protein